MIAAFAMNRESVSGIHFRSIEHSFFHYIALHTPSSLKIELTISED